MISLSLKLALKCRDRRNEMNYTRLKCEEPVYVLSVEDDEPYNMHWYKEEVDFNFILPHSSCPHCQMSFHLLNEASRLNQLGVELLEKCAELVRGVALREMEEDTQRAESVLQFSNELNLWTSLFFIPSNESVSKCIFIIIDKSTPIVNGVLLYKGRHCLFCGQ